MNICSLYLVKIILFTYVMWLYVSSPSPAAAQTTTGARWNTE